MHLVASTNTDVGHPFGGADGGEVRDPECVRTFRVKDPVNEVRGDVGATASVVVVTPRRRWTPRIPAVRMSPHEPGHLVPPDVVAARVAAMT